MTTRLPFYFMDVFAPRPLTGNPLSLVPDADDLDEARMRAIAREFNQSETTFVLRPSLPGATVRLRSLTAARVEFGGAGHNALGAWLWLENAGRLAAAGALRQEIAGQVLPVEVLREAGRPGGQPRGGWPGRARLAAAEVGVAAGGRRGLLPVQPGSGGRRRPRQVLQPDGRHRGRPRDRTAAGPLAARLVADGRVPDGSTVIIEQGYALGRPSRIAVSVAGQRVRLGGSGLVVAEGALLL